MKKRLQYAMPRVPLQQLKQQQKDGLPDNNMQEAPKNAICNWAALKLKLRKIIAAIKKKNDHKRPEEILGENIEEDIDLVRDEGIKQYETLFGAEGSRIYDNDKDADIYIEPFDNKEHKKKPETRTKNKNRLNINEDDLLVMQNMEIKLQKANRGRKLRVVVVESDSEDENSDIEEHLFGDKTKEHLAMVDTANSYELDESQHGNMAVQADVHQVDSVVREEYPAGFEANVENYLSRGAISEGKAGQIANDTSCENVFDMGHSGGARPKRKTDDSDQQKKHISLPGPRCSRGNKAKEETQGEREKASE